jgi:RNA polymerase sigma factor (TIGR02999 family)
MTAPLPNEISQLLAEWSGGDREALDALMPLVYEELRRLAHRYMARERDANTLQTTALVNEVYLRLINERGMKWQNRSHFFAVAAQLMRFILVDYARGHARQKRGGAAQQVTLDEAMMVAQDQADEMLALDEALTRLAAFDKRKSRIAEMRFFAGLSVEETAEVLSVSPETVMRDWRLARAWLRNELSG